MANQKRATETASSGDVPVSPFPPEIARGYLLPGATCLDPGLNAGLLFVLKPLDGGRPDALGFLIWSEGLVTVSGPPGPCHRNTRVCNFSLDFKREFASSSLAGEDSFAGVAAFSVGLGLPLATLDVWKASLRAISLSACCHFERSVKGFVNTSATCSRVTVTKLKLLSQPCEGYFLRALGAPHGVG